ncbi:MAG TPA: L,D-transpeptidase, partial [Polyangiaceae bacterium]
HAGPWLTILQPSVAIYSDANAERSNKLGYAQSGARLAVVGQPKPGERCNSGWMQVVPVGYVCTAAGTLDEKDARIKFTLKLPALDGILPYVYARNAKNGTPLYRSIPTRSQMLEYEPYLRKEPEPAPTDPNSPVPGAVSAALNTAPAPSAASLPVGNSSATAPAASAPPSDGLAKPASSVIDDRPWWQQEGIEDRLHELRLSDLHGESDGVLAMRMVKGFYVAVDRTFHWNGRLWYKTTKGLVAPADRMGQAAPSDFHGVELGTDWHMPVGWVFGGREKTTTYEIDLDKERIKVAGSVQRFEALQLTERRAEIKGTTYQELASGKWVKRDHLRIPELAEPPKDLKDHEHWVDVDLSTQSLVVYEGATPIYATLVSSGKSSKIKDKDHATPTGQWRIREKHLTTTMDGDGSAAGDLPYSIEDVPYVMYFHKSYAVHGAFWHRNYGMQMSHGCVNLSPLDAKAVFMKTEPALPSGWHGTWSSQNKPGSWVVVHE